MTPPTLANGELAYVKLPAIDIQRSADFYAKVFGWRIGKREDGSTAFDDPATCSDFFRNHIAKPAGSPSTLCLLAVKRKKPASG